VSKRLIELFCTVYELAQPNRLKHFQSCRFRLFLEILSIHFAANFKFNLFFSVHAGGGE
jgi:hypothetical protein